jgi:hypothetical protein
MTQERLDAAARRIYETLATKGHGPRPWVQHGALTPGWDELPEPQREDYRHAASAAFEAGLQERMTL